MTTIPEESQEDLEQKIDQAEKEVQAEAEDMMEALPEADESPEAEESPPEIPEKTKPSRARLIFRRILVWLVVIAISFAGGFFLDAALRYQPQVIRVNDLNQELAEAEGQISSLEGEINRLSEFEEQNLALEAEMELLTTHLTILSARAAVADAHLAVEQDRTADARLALDKVGSTLETLKSLLTPDQVEVVDNMIQRHALIMIELEDGGFTVQTDLEVLAVRLSTLENTLFASP